MRRERHTWRFVSGGLVAAILTGWIVSALSGQAAAQAADAENRAEVTLVQADWKVDEVIDAMAVEAASREQSAAETGEREAAEENELAREAAEAEARALAEAEAAAEAEAEAAANPEWISPSDARITSYYGQRNGRLHGGTDFGNNFGDDLWAIGDGTVTYAAFESGYGNVVFIDHGDGVETRYAHASELLVGVGDEVSQGDTIAITGSTGNSTGPHLHFEVLLNGEKVDSLAWLQEQGIDVG
ncbi:M23 family metallopeptidase [Glycomyces sp. NRRL B-16210]|uniref:M23 family metallopeptidase n=1 Tax=Glycomyces sp. NRRL B-16210 TaxID=1463821 RepID=UPI00106111F4|nr:M23 family metallopeptidase [Glycomyces sp. NRRL B-16210]